MIRTFTIALTWSLASLAAARQTFQTRTAAPHMPISVLQIVRGR